ncbi:hypothetical protein MAPG_07109 [Magnaporthiopsis poae ATCC 64411]|uniref:Uncharacterized protein n=1 Tax=Magnaporthiopsis poae (strain ATCC 64411 / 73-15) TaxID=644358 RepID=A0A0C4E3T8_MAGP6|nr:hypothetical protein MAPG_07109 [Magnaporthiopsis poae ATCC 64411]
MPFIGDTVEWDLISQLRECSQALVGHTLQARHRAVARSTRVHKLWTALRELNIHIRTTFMTLQLELLLQPDSEEEDGWYSDSESDGDDLSSEPSTASFHTAWEGQADRHGGGKAKMGYDSDDPDESFETMGRSRSLSQLQLLCSLLEARVNPLLVPLEGATAGLQPSLYPKLAHLVEYLKSSIAAAPHSRDNDLEFIPLPGSGTAPFLFNVSTPDQADTAEAFVSICESSSRWRPQKEIRKQMEADVDYMKEQILNFNIFVSTLKVSPGLLETLASRPIGSAPASTVDSFPGSSHTSDPNTADSFATSFTALQSFRQQIAAAIRAISSHFRLCEPGKHSFLLQLPSWEDISGRRHTTTMDAAQVVRFFFTGCDRGDWQYASIRMLRSGNSPRCRPGKQRLCKALTSAYNEDRDLEFYVSGAQERSDGRTEMPPIHVPLLPGRGRRYGKSAPGNNNLSTLIERDYFAKELSMDLIDHAGCSAAVFTVEQRRALAVKLVLGLMLSMNSDHSINTWEPKRIRFLEPLDAERTPFIVIDGDEPEAAERRWDCVSLADLDAVIDSGAEDDDAGDPKPLPPFTLLAKSLLHIAGQQMGSFRILRTKSGKDFHENWRRFRRTLAEYTKRVTCGRKVDLEALPFLHAAQNCLEFHTLYTAQSILAQDRPRMEIAWQLVFDDILARIDSSLRWASGYAQTVAVQGAHPPVPASQGPMGEFSLPTPLNNYYNPNSSLRFASTLPEVALFDGLDVAENSREAKNADIFFANLGDFHRSYSRFVAPRIVSTPSGEEHPRRIRIAVLDTGVDFRHPGIRAAKADGRIREEWCHSWVGPEADVADEDDEMHGSNCADLLHQVAPEADIYIGKIFQCNKLKTYQAENITKAIRHAVEIWKADIISMSFGLQRPAPSEDDDRQAELMALEHYNSLVEGIEAAIKRAPSNVTMFAAGSNGGKNASRAFPATLKPWVIAVHASDGLGGAGGLNPPLEADDNNFMTLGMGVGLMRREWDGSSGRLQPKYKAVRKCGTSFATPIAAGLAATAMDLSLRVDAITKRTREQLTQPVQMAKMLQLMSTGGTADYGGYRYVAPWHLWRPGWQADGERCRHIWNTINLKFRAH